MSNIEELKQLINYIRRRLPDEEKIDAAEHNRILNKLIDTLASIGVDVFLGVATLETIPNLPTGKCFYLATKKGNYVHFGDLVINSPLAVILWNGIDWEKHEIEVSVNVNVNIDDYINLSNYAKLTGDNEFIGNQKIIGSTEIGETRGKLRPVATHHREMINGDAVVWDDLLQALKTVKQVIDSLNWDGHKFPDYLNQPVKTDSDVIHKSVTAKSFTEEDNPDNENTVFSRLVETGGGYLGDLDNVSDETNTAQKGSVLIKDQDTWIPVYPTYSEVPDHDNLLMPVFNTLTRQWLYITIPGGGITPPTREAFPYTFSIVLS